MLLMHSKSSSRGLDIRMSSHEAACPGGIFIDFLFAFNSCPLSFFDDLLASWRNHLGFRVKEWKKFFFGLSSFARPNSPSLFPLGLFSSPCLSLPALSTLPCWHQYFTFEAYLLSESSSGMLRSRLSLLLLSSLSSLCTGEDLSYFCSSLFVTFSQVSVVKSWFKSVSMKDKGLHGRWEPLSSAVSALIPGKLQGGRHGVCVGCENSSNLCLGLSAWALANKDKFEFTSTSGS